MEWKGVRVGIVGRIELSCNEKNFYVRTMLKGRLGEEIVFEKDERKSVERMCG